MRTVMATVIAAVVLSQQIAVAAQTERSMPPGMMFYVAVKVREKSNDNHFSYVLDMPYPVETSGDVRVGGVLCAEDAFKRTRDPVNLNIEKKIYECVIGPKGLKSGKAVHNVPGRLVSLDEVTDATRIPDVVGVFVVVTPGE